MGGLRRTGKEFTHQSGLADPRLTAYQNDLSPFGSRSSNNRDNYSSSVSLSSSFPAVNDIHLTAPKAIRRT